jgi:4-diphosphocytidyl-2-C-methyl-D-erythritol kinase
MISLRIFHIQNKMITFPNAKINLGLNITEKLPDGYHSIESVLYPVPLCDILEIEIAVEGKFSFNSSGLNIDCDNAGNLCVRAYRLLQDRFGISPVKIWLHKIIPSGAGLGGGSADAAFTLLMLNELFNLNLNTPALKELASLLGMDCPFFVENLPAFAQGRGDVLTPLDLSLSGKTICIARPDIHISTSGAYAGVTPHQGQISPATVTAFTAASWKGKLKNQFEETLFVKYPQLQFIVDSFYDSGAVYASLSGSGSAMYGIFNSAPNLHSRFENMFYWEGELKE